MDFYGLVVIVLWIPSVGAFPLQANTGETIALMLGLGVGAQVLVYCRCSGRVPTELGVQQQFQINRSKHMHSAHSYSAHIVE